MLKLLKLYTITMKTAAEKNEEAELIYNQYKDAWKTWAIAHQPLGPGLDISNLPSDYIEIYILRSTPYYVHTHIYSLTKNIDNRALVRALFVAIADGNPIGRFIFGYCKYAKIRKPVVNHTTYIEAMNTFHTYICPFSKVWRTGGNKIYCAQNGYIRSNHIIRSENKRFLSTLAYGPDHSTDDLTCMYSGIPVENMPILDSYIDGFDVHHAKFAGGASYFFSPNTFMLVEKQTEPSAYIGSLPYKFYTLDIIFELMSTIILESGVHTRLHKISSNGSAADWIQLYKDKKCVYIPYAWRGKEEYDILIRWIRKEYCLPKSTLLPTYEKFITMIS